MPVRLRVTFEARRGVPLRGTRTVTPNDDAMKSSIPLLFALLLALASPASAHRLDEYLQATTVDVAGDRVAVRVRLTPGVAVLDTVLPAIDADGDGALSAGERSNYAERVCRDLALRIDGREVALRSAARTFADVDAMRDGLGTIELDFTADVPAGTRHTLALENHHQPAISAYLVNALTPADAAIRIDAQDRSYDQSTYRLDYAHASAASPAPWLERAGGRSVFGSFFAHGVRHILTGYDHLLFVAALALGAATWRELVKVVSAFTLCHTLTLTLAAYGVVGVPARIVEPLVAASIVVVALQNVVAPRPARGAGRLVVAGFFGLFHGLGFAGGLPEAMGAMPGGTLLLALVAFSLGVEVGHQAIVLPLFAALRTIRRARPDEDARFVGRRVGSGLISAAGAYYLCVAIVAAI